MPKHNIKILSFNGDTGFVHESNPDAEKMVKDLGKIFGWGWFDGTQLIWSPKGDKKWMCWNGTDAGDRERWLLNEGGLK